VRASISANIRFAFMCVTSYEKVPVCVSTEAKGSPSLREKDRVRGRGSELRFGLFYLHSTRGG
jgi:hypothetical protein